MLLLVLILVLIAFGLLVVALLSSSVLWAWVSVGVSIAAAAVLLVDWLQRRAAVKAGPESVSEPTRAPAMSDFEPVTEVLSIVPKSGPSGPGTASGAAPQAQAGSRFDVVPDGQQTVVMPVVQPSGSPTRPPGAEPSVTSSSVFSSPNVTNPGVDRPTPPSAPSGSSAVDEPVKPESPADPDATVFATAPDELRRDPERRPAEDRIGDAEATVMVDIRKGSTAPATDAAATTPEQTVSPATPEQTVSPVTPEQTVGTGSGPAESGSGAAAAAPEGDSAAVVVGTPDMQDTPAGGVDPADTTIHSGAAPDEPVGVGGGGSIGSTSEVADADGEAPEEAHDPAVAALVAGLYDEVVVIDEHPRYHVTGCRALATAQPIPLPAREAVELGFTPCGWCSPDRTLAGRHPAAAR